MKNRMLLVAGVVVAAFAALFVIKLVTGSGSTEKGTDSLVLEVPAVSTDGSSTKEDDLVIIGGADGPTSVYVVGKKSSEAGSEDSTESVEDTSVMTESSVEDTSSMEEESTDSTSAETEKEMEEQTEQETEETTEQVTEIKEAQTTTQAADESSSGFYQNIQITDVSKGVLVLCNKNYKLPDDFQPAEITYIPENYYVKDGKEYKMAKVALDAFVEMSDAAMNEVGVNLLVISGYRTKAYQEMLYNHYANSYGKESADTYSARPRHSEHETGLCCDINMVDEAFKDTAAYAWMVDNAADYGFILRYPEGKEGITGYIYEPWHWRYVGVDVAKAVVASGLTYDEYYELHIK